MTVQRGTLLTQWTSGRLLPATPDIKIQGARRAAAYLVYGGIHLTIMDRY